MADNKQSQEEFDFSKIPIDALKYDAISVGNPKKLKRVAQSVGALETLGKWIRENEGKEFAESFVVETNGMSEFFGSVDYEYAVRMQCPSSILPKGFFDVLIDNAPDFATLCAAPLIDDLISIEMNYGNVAADISDDNYETQQAVTAAATEPLVLEHAVLLWHSRLVKIIGDSDGFDYRELGEQATDFIDRVGTSVLSAVIRRISVNFKSQIEEEDYPRFSVSLDSGLCRLSVQLPVDGIHMSYDDLMLIHKGFPDKGFVSLDKETEDDLIINLHFPIE